MTEVEDPGGEVAHKIERAALMISSMGAQRLAVSLQERAEERRLAAAHERVALDERWNAERSAARAVVGAVDDGRLATAQPKEVAAAWRQAHAWASVDPSFAPDAERLRRRIEAEWGVDVGDGENTEERLRAAADRELAAARDLEAQQVRAVDDVASGVVLGTDESPQLVQAEVAGAEANRHRDVGNALAAQADGVGYDTDARRRQLGARAKEAGVDHATVDGRVRAASANAEPVKNATAGTKRAGRARGKAPAQRTRATELGR